jgi:hypothetical protein
MQPMNSPGSFPSRIQIYQKLNQKSTAELLEIWRTGGRAGWRGDAYNMIGEILQKRLGYIPQNTTPSYPARIPGISQAPRSPRTPWLMILGGIGLVVILALIVFSPFSQKSGRPTSPINNPIVPSASAFTPTNTTTLKTKLPTPLTTSPGESPTPVSTFDAARPATGMITSNNGGGHGLLTVENGTNQDGIAILTLNDVPVLASYIRSGDSFTMRGIQDGVYFLYFSTGTDWNGKTFATSPTYKKFEDPFPFETKATTYTSWRVTLQGVVGGNAAAENVNPNAFPQIGY